MPEEKTPTVFNEAISYEDFNWLNRRTTTTTKNCCEYVRFENVLQWLCELAVD